MIKVLVVEDDPMVGKLHEHYLTQIKGFQLCDIVRNSDEALKIMQTKEYNLVILDIFMPGMNGVCSCWQKSENRNMMSMSLLYPLPMIKIRLKQHCG